MLEEGANGPAPGAGETASAVLTIDLGAISANYRALARRAGSAECAAVVGEASNTSLPHRRRF